MLDKVKEVYNKISKLNLIWVVDPKTEGPSVSLTLLVVTFVAVLVSWGLVLAGKVKDVGPIMEAFYATASLYFGRKFSVKVGNKSVDADTTEENK